MSVSVLTDQRLKDQNITDLNSAMRNMPGVTVLPDHSADELAFYSRGFQITQFQFDGGAAMSVPNSNYKPVIDLSLYDHIELVRGAAGTFNGYGAPGGIINLVRKKPLDHQQFLLDMQIGSWDWHRISVDVSGPLAFEGRLRGRLIATHQDNKFFYDVAKADRNVLSGTLEYDLTGTTLISAGFNYQQNNDIPFPAGLMRYRDGTLLPLPRSTCFCFDFAKSNSMNKEMFGEVDQRIGADWTVKLKATKIKQKTADFNPWVSGALNPFTGEGATAFASGYTFANTRQTMLEATFDGNFRMFGREQKLVLGANYSTINPAGTKGTFQGFNPYTFQEILFGDRTSNNVDALHFNPSDWGVPIIPPGYAAEVIYGDNRYVNSYANLILTPIKHLHVSTGVRYSTYRVRGLARNFCFAGQDQDPNSACFGKPVGSLVISGAGFVTKGRAFSWPPSVQWSYDITNNLTGSANYTDIYVDQSANLNINGTPLPPITGGNFEGELKWLSPNKRLNTSLSIYYTKQNGFAFADPICAPLNPPAKCTIRSTNNVGQLNTQQNCCFIFDPTRKNISYGADLEIQGEIAGGWQLSASYNFNYNVQKGGDKLFTGSYAPLLSYAPRHRGQLWTTYSFAEGSRLAGLVVGFGAQAQSKTFVQDGYCTGFYTAAEDPTRSCKPGQFFRVFFTDPGHVVFSGSLGYKVSDALSFDLQMENLLDKTYFERVGGIDAGNFYGSPRSFKLSMRTKF